MNIIKPNLKWKGAFTLSNVPKLIVLHHAEASKCTIEDINRWHQERGWIGVGYHYFIRKDGSIYKGRPDNAEGAHCKGYNAKSIGICYEGSYMKETMPEIQKQAGIELNKYIIEAFKITEIKPHRSLNNTSCPGTNFPFDEIKSASLSKNKADGNNQNTSDQKIQINTSTKIVKDLQRLLNTLGIKDNSNKMLTEDGIKGPHTYEAIANIKPLKIGSTGDIVKWVQERLNAFGFNSGNVDGIFGVNTLNAVESFQNKKHLKIDGIVDRNTITELLK